MKPDKKLLVYFALAYLFSWIVFVPLALNRYGVIFLFTDNAEHARTMDVWHAFGGLGPIVSAIITILLFNNGRKGIRTFFNSYSLKKLTPTGWLLAFSPILLFCFGIP